MEDGETEAKLSNQTYLKCGVPNPLQGPSCPRMGLLTPRYFLQPPPPLQKP